MSTWEMPVRKKGGRALPIIVGGAFAVVVGVGALVLPGMLGGDGSEGVAAPELSGTLVPTASPGASADTGTELPPLVGEATRASIFNDSSLAGIDLGEPVAVTPDLGFPVYALTDEVRAAMGPGWILWSASDPAGDPESATQTLFVSSLAGTTFTYVDALGQPIQLVGAGWDYPEEWFPPAAQAFMASGCDDCWASYLIDLSTGEWMDVPSDYEGLRSGDWDLLGTRADGTQVWSPGHGGDGGDPLTVNLVALETRSLSGEWKSIHVDYSGLLIESVMDPTATRALVYDYGEVFGLSGTDEWPSLPDLAIIDTVAETRTDVTPVWPDGFDRCGISGWIDEWSFLASCAAESSGSGERGAQATFRIFLDGVTPTEEIADPYAGLEEVAWRSSIGGLVQVRAGGDFNDIVELDVDHGSGRVKILDLARLAEVAELESDALGATSFEVWEPRSAGGSLVVAEGSVGTMRFCVAVDTDALTYDVVALGPEAGQSSNRALRCGEWGTAYYEWP